MKKLILAIALLLALAAPAGAWEPGGGWDTSKKVLGVEALGSEALTNTCAAWGLAAPVGAWSCSGTTITRTASGSDLQITNNAATADTVYKVTLPLLTVTAGSVTFSGAGAGSTPYSVAGTKTLYLTGVTTSAFSLTATASYAGTIDIGTMSARPVVSKEHDLATPLIISTTVPDAEATECATLIKSTQTGAGGNKTTLRVQNVGSGTGTEIIQDWYKDGTRVLYIDQGGTMIGASYYTNNSTYSNASVIKAGTTGDAYPVYVQLDDITADTAGPPAAGDCDSAFEVGRMIISNRYTATAEWRIWVCVNTGASAYGWKYTVLN